MTHEEKRENYKTYYETHKEEKRAYYETHKEEKRAYQREYRKANKEKVKEYRKADVNSLGQTKDIVRHKSQNYLNKYGKKIPGYEIHHCCSYSEPYKFIYCSKEMHQLIHSYLRQHNIDADSDHYEQIKHLLDDTVVLYGIV